MRNETGKRDIFRKKLYTDPTERSYASGSCVCAGNQCVYLKQIHTAVTRIDAVFSSNTAVNELSESLEQVESTVMNI
mgnify:CR=1 FL=1